jgi:tetratricopeptide (TPR) repeat protein
MDQAPFDVVTLDKANDGKVYKVYPLRLPGRRVPEKPRPSEKLRVKLLENEQEYDIAWSNIVKLELYEQLVLAETNKLAAEGKLDDAYEQLNFLFAYYPQTPGLAEARQSYLYISSAAAFRQQKLDEALALLEELHAQNPNYKASESSPTVLQRLGDVADRLTLRIQHRSDGHLLVVQGTILAPVDEAPRPHFAFTESLMLRPV